MKSGSLTFSEGSIHQLSDDRIYSIYERTTRCRFFRYVVSRNDCLNFKKLAADFSAYSSLDSILLDPRKELSEAKLYSLKYNWECLKLQNVHKAN